MSTINKTRPSRAFALVIGVVAAMLLAACDTSSLQSGIEGTGITDTVATTAVSRGPIQSIDVSAVKVNGVTWSASAAKIVIDGAADSAPALKVGMMATVQGERTAPDRGTATVIETQIVVRGPILEIGAGNRLNVLGQTIHVDNSTGASFTELSVGQIVAVSGFITGFGDVRATLIEASVAMNAPDWVVQGAVAAVDPGVRRFAINGLEVVYAPDLLAGLPSGAIETGQVLSVSGRELTGDGALIATSIALYDPSLPATGGQTVLTGIVFRIDGDRIPFWNQAIVLLPGASIRGDLTTGVYVRVTGTISGGILYASDVLVLGIGAGLADFVGRIDSVDVAARTLTMFGIEFDVGETLFSGQPGYLSFDDLAVGNRVQIYSYENRVVVGITPDYLPPGVAGPDWISGEYFRDLSPPVQFTLYGVADWVVQVTGIRFFGYGGGFEWLDGSEISCGVNSVSAERFWELAGQPKLGKSYVGAWGRFEGNLFMAESVFLCVESPLE